MLLQVSQHCEEHQLQPDYQSAYREHYSCGTVILKISNDILWGMEAQSITSLVALDLSAAFDTVNHCKRIGLVQLLVMSIKSICRYSSTWCHRENPGHGTKTARG